MLGRCLVIWMVVSLPVLAQSRDDEEDEDFRPGLIATTQSHAGGPPLEEVVSSPIGLPLEKPGSVKQVWTGKYLVRGDGPHQFHAFVSGTLSVRLGDQEILQAKTTSPAWVSGPDVELVFGEQPLTITAELSQPNDQFKLYWSSSTFPLEPLPYHALFHDSDSTPLRQAREGRDLADAWRCRSCHGEKPTAAPLPGPSLVAFGTGTDARWLKERLTRTEPEPHSRMPAFGFSDADADAILAYLAHSSRPFELKGSPLKRNDKDVAAGQKLLKSVGCLACHGWNELGKNPLFGGGTLDGVAEHRTAAWIEAKLAAPERVNPDSRMPTFDLTDVERRQITLALLPAKAPEIVPLKKDNTSTDELVARGRQLIQEARCAACHQIPGDVPAFAMVSDKSLGERITRQGCVAEAVDSTKHRPKFATAAAEVLAIGWGKTSLENGLEAISGERLLTLKGCLNCHDRNGSRGLAAITKDIVQTEPTWEGQTPTLQPPSLTAVGDRLQDAALLKGVRGELPRRMDWLKVRMPRFRHTADEAQLLTTNLITRDRIPDAPPATPDYPISHGQADPHVMLAGRELTGGKGFSCVACHQLKDYVPPKVALGTRGSDLYRLGDRMRAPYFFRWTRSPLRLLPGVEMPSYQRPHPTFLGGQLEPQLAAIWDALHDPQFTAPTNPAVVEQLWGPSKSGAPRILRDVVTITDAQQKVTPVPRVFAVGFANRHNVLFDLEHGLVRSWTIGDFARQRTQGKSWFWDMAGVPIATDFPLVPDIYLYDERMKELIAPETGWTPSLTFRHSQIAPDHSVRFEYALQWSKGDDSPARSTVVYETWAEAPNGWKRDVIVLELSHGHSVWLRRPSLVRTFGQPQIEVNGNAWGQPSISAPQGLALAGPAIGEISHGVTYRSSVAAPDVSEQPPLPINTPVEAVTCIPGFTGTRLPLPRTIMPTAMTWDRQGRLVFTSLKGHVYRVEPGKDAASLPSLTLVAEGLAAPFGIASLKDGLLVAHKPEVLKLVDNDKDGYAERSWVVASGWGFTEDYHDWTCGIAEDSEGRYYIGLGSDYSHKNRPKHESRYRGNILRFDLSGSPQSLQSLATGLRYPTGFAMLPGDRLVVSDQQGVQNCFNELDFIQAGHRYGVPAQLDPRDDAPTEVAALQIPHPWTRSVNGLAVWPDNGHPFAGQIVGAEYNGRFLIRAATEMVNGVMQGAVFPLHRPGETNGPEELLGPMAVAFSPEGDLYVGSLHDSGWMGGLNTGDLVRFQPNDTLPNGIRQIRATPAGFAIDFLQPIDPQKGADVQQYQLSGYTRVWQGEYATPDSGRHTPTVTAARVSADGKTVELSLEGLRTGHVYDFSVGSVTNDAPLWPSVGYYTLHQRP